MTSTRRRRLIVASLLVLGLAGTGLALWLQGYRVYVVHTGSMEPTYRPGDVVIDKPPTGNYHRGDVITFLHSEYTDDVVTHRVVGVTPQGLIHTKGDANRTRDAWDIRPDRVRGTVWFTVPALGYLVVYLRNPAGIASLATGLLAIALLWGIFFPAADDPAPDPKRPNRPRPQHRPRPGATPA